MAKIKIGIVEDEMIIAQGIIQLLEELGYETTEPAISYTEALGMIVSEQPDILLLDIQLKGHKDGIDLAWKVKEEYSIPFIFLTANSDPATVERVKKLNPPAFLVKPFDKGEVFAAIEICLHNYVTGINKRVEVPGEDFHIKGCLFIKNGQNFQKIRIADIMYLESDNVYVHVHTRDSKLMLRNSIQGYLELINDNSFFRVHKSFAVNTNHIDAINSESIFIKNTEIPVGRAYRENLFNFLRLGN